MDFSFYSVIEWMKIFIASSDAYSMWYYRKDENLNKTLIAYDIAANDYEKKFINYNEYKKRIEYFAKLFTKESSILDAGCGPGLNSIIFSNMGLVVEGFDISKQMVKLAMKNCPTGTFSVSSVENFITNKKYDGICLSFIIVHLTKKETVSLISKIKDYINDKGKVYISFMTGKAHGYETTSFSKKEIYFNYYEKDEIISLFVSRNFQLISADSAPYHEQNGDITEDVFLIFDYQSNGLEMSGSPNWSRLFRDRVLNLRNLRWGNLTLKPVYWR